MVKAATKKKAVVKKAAVKAAPAKKAPAKKAAAKAASQWGSRLKAAKGTWNKARAEAAAQAASGNNLPDGLYTVQLVGAEFGESQNKNFMCTFTWQVLQGECAGKKQYQRQMLVDEKNYVFFGKVMARLGVDVEAMEVEEIEEALAQLVAAETQAVINVKTDGDFVNVYVNRLLAEAVEAEAPAGGEEPEAEEPEEEPAEEEEPEEEAEPEDDGLDAMDRAELKKIVKDEGIEFTVYKNTADDAIREAIREARGAAEPEEEAEPEAEPEEEEAEAVELVVGTAVAASYKGKEVNGKVVALNEEEETVTVQPDKGQPFKNKFTVSVEAIEVL